MLITSIENLSNEFFYEIFDYLNAWDIYDAFSNLNYRFEQLLNNSSVLYKIKLINRTMSNDVLIKNCTFQSKTSVFNSFIHVTKHQSIGLAVILRFIITSFTMVHIVKRMKTDYTINWINDFVFLQWN
jgi:hypothetical protein